MAQQAPLEQLAAQLYASAQTITQYCKKEHHPQKSWDHVEPQTLLPPNAPQSILTAQQSIHEAATKIQRLVNDPADFLASFQVQTLATLASVPLNQLKSIARMAMTANFLREPVPGEVAHSSTSAAMIQNPLLYDWALFMTSTSAMMASQTVEATEKYGATDSKTQTTYNVWKDTDKPFFDSIKQSKELTRQFASYMKSVASGKGTHIQHLLTGYDWASLGKVTVVDLGGSNGHASIALAEAFPNLSFIIQDLPDTIESSRPDLSSLPDSIASRLTYQHHDFFTKQPLHDVDVFLLRMIIHDWPAAEAKSIIANIVESMKPGGKLIIMDTVLPPPGSVPVVTEAVMRVRDLSMMQVHNSKEREMEEWVELLKGADEKLEVRNMVQPFGSSMSVLEVVREDEGVVSSTLDGAVGNTKETAVPLTAMVPGLVAT
ncbi:MAG: hypothetical protein Q9190_000381 [Brigantiaea leucoxantha]